MIAARHLALGLAASLATFACTQSGQLQHGAAPAGTGTSAQAASALTTVPGVGIIGSASDRDATQQAFPGLPAIKAEDLRRDLFTLASDSMRGRLGGSQDELRASMWLADRAREAGMLPAGDDGTYFQFFPIGRVTQSKGTRLIVGADTFRIQRDFVVTAVSEGEYDAPAVWVDDVSPATLQRVGVQGKVVFAPVRLADSVAALSPTTPIRQSVEGRRAQAGITAAANALRAAGASAAILVADAAVERNFDLVGYAATFGRYSRDTMQVAPARLAGGGGGGGGGGAGRAGGAPQNPAIPIVVMRAAQLPKARAASQAHLSLYVDRFVIPSVNIVAVIPGTDPVLRNEYVIYSSHQDHDGLKNAIDGDNIWNGADDNATTSVALLAIGRAIKAAPARRSSLFIWHGAEERGLMGSYWYAVHPTVPKASLVAVLNGDMIGRNHPDTAALLGVTSPHRNSQAFVDMAMQANTAVSKFVIDSSWDATTHPEGWYFRSDHMPYACAGVPALFFSTLLHPDYHTPQDEADRINIPKLTKMTQWMYATGWTVSNAAQRVSVDPGFRLERACQI
jgi:hypothetical protein